MIGRSGSPAPEPDMPRLRVTVGGVRLPGSLPACGRSTSATHSPKPDCDFSLPAVSSMLIWLEPAPRCGGASASPLVDQDLTNTGFIGPAALESLQAKPT